ncbi:hypothetical protein L873DRAFT_1811446 [Choiromyces venosus 120613-1]|uniref:Uncharacterized protein n=1 Tax=Choiromyces venosus 120613-1 TaxID=1336337 RepID=A0A3N4JDI3_9PEZI|nr:hypothetical protein L873DRAFT_1811446 [Choiromyces venosus 120613-1]
MPTERILPTLSGLPFLSGFIIYCAFHFGFCVQKRSTKFSFYLPADSLTLLYLSGGLANGVCSWIQHDEDPWRWLLIPMMLQHLSRPARFVCL